MVKSSGDCGVDLLASCNIGGTGPSGGWVIDDSSSERGQRVR